MRNTKRARKLPKHWSEAKNEAEEARWRDANSERWILKAARRGALKMSTLKQLLAEIQPKEETRLLSLRLPVSDIELAKLQAGKKGMGYQTYLKSLVHQALRRARVVRLASSRRNWAMDGFRRSYQGQASIYPWPGHATCYT